MHKVRWNVNKGSEKWLRYGGATGIVRCQEIVLSDIESVRDCALNNYIIVFKITVNK